MREQLFEEQLSAQFSCSMLRLGNGNVALDDNVGITVYDIPRIHIIPSGSDILVTFRRLEFVY